MNVGVTRYKASVLFCDKCGHKKRDLSISIHGSSSQYERSGRRWAVSRYNHSFHLCNDCLFKATSDLITRLVEVCRGTVKDRNMKKAFAAKRKINLMAREEKVSRKKKRDFNIHDIIMVE